MSPLQLRRSAGREDESHGDGLAEAYYKDSHHSLEKMANEMNSGVPTEAAEMDLVMMVNYLTHVVAVIVHIHVGAKLL